MPANVTKTTVYLDTDEYERLKAIASRDGRTTAELVREAVRRYAARRERGSRPRSLGAGRSGAGDLSERAEDLLRGMGKR